MPTLTLVTFRRARRAEAGARRGERILYRRLAARPDRHWRRRKQQAVLRPTARPQKILQARGQQTLINMDSDGHRGSALEPAAGVVGRPLHHRLGVRGDRTRQTTAYIQLDRRTWTATSAWTCKGHVGLGPGRIKDLMIVTDHSTMMERVECGGYS